ncbi:RHO1 GDP-GTP exchange protein 2 [Tulasnella sp. 408]|nr:RHO1 GDP-GTP exchange protein 2 [Tulasnella sp. 408]
MDLEMPGPKQGGRNSPHTPQETRDTALVAAPKAGRLSEPSTDDAPLPSRVSNLTTDFDSPTRSRGGEYIENPISRPSMGQQARSNTKLEPDLRKTLPNQNLRNTSAMPETGALWIDSVPPGIVASVSEKRRQEAINELIETERDFLQDMEYMRDLPQFIEQVFWNLEEIITISTRLSDALNKRQESQAAVERIGDIYVDVVKDFEPFVRYGGHQMYGELEFEKEKTSNPAFAQFVEETQGPPRSRKLELNGYLTKPSTRLARCSLLLESVHKYTSDHHPDKVPLEQVIQITRGFLKRLSKESGKTEGRLTLLQLDQQLVFPDVERVDLRLRDESRRLLHKGTLKRRGGRGDNGDLQVFLLDQVLLTVEANTDHGPLYVYKRPIPLELLVVETQEEYTSRTSLSNELEPDNRREYPINFTYLGRKGYVLELWASTAVGRKEWLEKINKQQEVVRKRSMKLDTVSLSEEPLLWWMKLSCAVPLGDGHRIAYGAESGVFLTDLRGRPGLPRWALTLPDVKQVDVLADCELLVVLSQRSVMTIPLDSLDAPDRTVGLKRAKKVASNTSFFKIGTHLGRTLLCVVNARALPSTIKLLEPNAQAIRAKNKSSFRSLFLGGNSTFRVFKEFDIPVKATSVHFLGAKLCVGCAEGFQIVDLDTLDIKPLLDPADSALEFVRMGLGHNTPPTAIYRNGDEFLLCYDGEFRKTT